MRGQDQPVSKLRAGESGLTVRFRAFLDGWLKLKSKDLMRSVAFDVPQVCHAAVGAKRFLKIFLGVICAALLGGFTETTGSCCRLDSHSSTTSMS